VISPTQRLLPDNTQHSQQTDIHAPAGFEPTIPASERPQTHALDRTATGIGCVVYSVKIFLHRVVHSNVARAKHLTEGQTECKQLGPSSNQLHASPAVTLNALHAAHTAHFCAEHTAERSRHSKRGVVSNRGRAPGFALLRTLQMSMASQPAFCVTWTSVLHHRQCDRGVNMSTCAIYWLFEEWVTQQYLSPYSYAASAGTTVPLRTSCNKQGASSHGRYNLFMCV
jgi:hypothetical protein